MKRMITFVAVGGLANRMRSIASAVLLAERSGSGLEIVWFRDKALHAPFGGLFEPVDMAAGRLRDASVWDYLLLDRPRLHNLYIPFLYQKRAFRSRLYERSVTPLCQGKFDFAAWAVRENPVYMASYTAFLPYDASCISRLFVPVKEIRREVDRRCGGFNSSMIGVHVRRTDHLASTSRSPVELFFRKIDLEIDKDGRTRVYLATDAQEVKRDMKWRYGGRLIVSERPAGRDSLQGMRDGVADMYSLSRTRKIYGSFQSSFSELASQIGGVPLEIVKI